MSESEPYGGDRLSSPERPYGAANDVRAQPTPYLDGNGVQQSTWQRGFDAERPQYAGMTPTAQQAAPMAVPPSSRAKKRSLPTLLSIVPSVLLVVALVVAGVLVGKLGNANDLIDSLGNTVEDREGKIDSLTSDLSAATNQLAQLQSKLSSAQSDLRKSEALLAEIREPAYLSSVRDAVPELHLVDDSQLLSLGRIICTRLGEGHSTQELISLAAGNYTPSEASSIVITTQHILCD